MRTPIEIYTYYRRYILCTSRVRALPSLLGDSIALAPPRGCSHFCVMRTRALSFSTHSPHHQAIQPIYNILYYIVNLVLTDRVKTGTFYFTAPLPIRI